MRVNVEELAAARSGRTGWPVLWAVAGLLLVALSTIQKLPCLRGRVDTDVLATAQCYSDVPLFYVGRGLAADFGWLGHLGAGFRNLEYPPLINLFIEASAKLTHVVAGVSGVELDRRSALTEPELFALPGMAGEERLFFIVTCVGLLVAVLVAVWIAWRAGWVVGDRVVWLMVAPLLVLTLTVNWDALALAASAGALAMWQRRRMALFGALVAVGTAAKLFPLVLLAAGLILAIKMRSLRSVVAMGLTFAVVTVAANAPLYLSNHEAWREFWDTNTAREESFGSAWFALRMAGAPLTADQLSLVLAVGMLVVWGVCAALTWTRILEPTFCELALVFLLAFFMLGKVYSPQYSLWVVLALLFVTRNRWLIAAVAVFETFHYVETWLYIRGITTPDVGIDKTYWFSIVLRLAVEGVVVLHILYLARRRAASAESSAIDRFSSVVVPRGGRAHADLPSA